MAGTRYFLPSFFGPPRLFFDIEPGLHSLIFNLDTGPPRAAELSRLHVTVWSRDRVFSYPDGAQLYRCRFSGPRQIARIASGFCAATGDGDYALRVFHHTTPDAAANIRRSRELWSSPWTLAGTRRLVNVAYANFTSLPSIRSEEDLRRIAMSSDAEVRLQTTSDRLREVSVSLPVYLGDTATRTATMTFHVATRLLAPAPLWLHPLTRANDAYFEVVGAEILRVAMQPGATLTLAGHDVACEAENLKSFDYVVLGDASSVEGLQAPYAEEETVQVTHLERLSDQMDIFDFWRMHQNQDLVSARHVEPHIIAQEDT